MDFEQIVRWYFAGEKAEAIWIRAAQQGPRIQQVVKSFAQYRIGCVAAGFASGPFPLGRRLGFVS